jgi:hypothetical protein
MRLVGIALLGALLSAGCAMQTGDPNVDETGRPNELTATPGGGEGVRPVSTAADEFPAEPVPTQTGPKASRTGSISNPAGAGVPPAGPKDNPNPSPWGNGFGGPQAPAGGGGN